MGLSVSKRETFMSACWAPCRDDIISTFCACIQDLGSCMFTSPVVEVME